MPKRHRILIVDDDHGLREALTEQLSLYEDFEAVAVDIKACRLRRLGRPIS
jgi:DNA-binding NarL/FixJ family response regulator